jgi:hypothetical protein
MSEHGCRFETGWTRKRRVAGRRLRDSPHDNSRADRRPHAFRSAWLPRCPADAVGHRPHESRDQTGPDTLVRAGWRGGSRDQTLYFARAGEAEASQAANGSRD